MKKYFKQLINYIFSFKSTLLRPYVVKYLTQFGAMTINESEYKCLAYNKYHAWKQFVKNTKNESHYSDRTVVNTYSRWIDDIYLDK